MRTETSGTARGPGRNASGQASISATASAATSPTTTVGLAPTLALSGMQGPTGEAGTTTAPLAPPRGVLARSWEAFTYVFRHIRERIDTEGRKRRLVEEREGAKRLLEGALFDLGQLVLAAPESAPPLADLVNAVAEARARKDAAVSDLAAAERLQHVSDLRLGIEQSTAETEWQACVAGAAEVDKLLRDVERDRRKVEDELRALAGPSSSSAGARSAGESALETAGLNRKRALMDDHYRSLRERAAALRAATIAARAKFDQATAARREGAAAVASSLSAHARDRAEALQTIRELTIQIGRAAADSGLPSPAQAGHAHVARLEATIADRERQLAGLHRTIAGYDTRKLALGVTLLLALAALIIGATWALLR